MQNIIGNVFNCIISYEIHKTFELTSQHVGQCRIHLSTHLYHYIWQKILINENKPYNFNNIQNKSIMIKLPYGNTKFRTLVIKLYFINSKRIILY